MFACVDIIRRDIAESFMIAPVVVILDESLDGFLEFAWHLVGHEVDCSLHGPMVSFDFPVGLRMVR